MNALDSDPIMSVYISLNEAVSKSNIVSNQKFEIQAFLFVLIDLCVFSVCKDPNMRIFAHQQFDRALFISFSKEEADEFDLRTSQYGAIARGDPIRAECTFGEQSSFSERPILRLIIALTDFLSNPSARDDYNNAPVLLHEVFDCMQLYEIAVKEVYPIAVNYYDQLRDTVNWMTSGK